MPPFAVLWEFRVRPENRAAFLLHYGPEETCAALFRSAPGYVETRLLEDAADPGRFVTIDRWEDAASYGAFQSTQTARYEALDRRCEGLADEREIGSFVEEHGAS